MAERLKATVLKTVKRETVSGVRIPPHPVASQGAEVWEITYRFAGSPNRSGLTVGPIIGISKKGWEYMWVRYADSEDTVAKAIVKKPVAVYIERVHDEGNFAALGIGT